MPCNLSKITLVMLAVIASRSALAEEKATQKDENDIDMKIIIVMNSSSNMIV